MCQVSFNIPNDYIASMQISSEEASAYARATFAVGAYVRGGISVEYAAQLAGIAEEDFLALLNGLGIRSQDPERERAMSRLLLELEKGRRSAERAGYIPSAEVREHLRRRLEGMRP